MNSVYIALEFEPLLLESLSPADMIGLELLAASSALPLLPRGMFPK